MKAGQSHVMLSERCKMEILPIFLEWDGVDYIKSSLNFSEQPCKLVGDSRAIKHEEDNEIKLAKLH